MNKFREQAASDIQDAFDAKLNDPENQSIISIILALELAVEERERFLELRDSLNR